MAQKTSVRKILISVVSSNKNLRILHNEFKKLNETMSASAKISGMLRNALSMAVAAIGVSQITDIMDTMQQMNDRFVALTGSGETAKKVFESLSDVSKNVKISVQDLGDTFSRFYIALQRYGLGVKDISVILQSLSQYLRLSGSSAQESASFIIQFSQALSLGRLQGQEFRAAMLSNAKYATELAESLGVNTGQLKAMAEKGQITIDKMLMPMVQNFDRLNKQASNLNTTFGQTMTLAFDRVKVALNDLNKKFKLSAKFGTLVGFIFNNLTSILTGLAITTLPLLIKAIGNLVISLTFASTSLLSVKGAFVLVGLAVTVLTSLEPKLLNFSRTFSYVGETINKFTLKVEGAFLVLKNKTSGIINDIADSLPKWIPGMKSLASSLKIVNTASQAMNGKRLREINNELHASEKHLKALKKSFDEEKPMQKMIGDTTKDLDRLKKKLLEIGKQNKGAGNPFTELNKQLLNSKFTLRAVYKYADAVRNVKIKQFRNQLDLGKISLIDYNKKLMKVTKETEKFKKTARTDFFVGYQWKGIAKGIDDYIESAKTGYSALESVARNTFQNLENSLTDFVMKGKLSFKNMVNSMVADLARLILRAQIVKPLAGYVSGLMPTTGAVKAHAQGGVINSPILFPMASGMGLAGEAGPEAIMPLRRDKSGNLGVSGSPVVVNVVNNAPGTEATYKESKGKNGGKVIEVMIVEKVKDAINNGSLDRVFSNSYGLRRKGY